MPSDIPTARSILSACLPSQDPQADMAIRSALSLMKRDPTTRRAKGQRVFITPGQLYRAQQLVDNTDLPLTEICVRIGLGSKDLGRLSEKLRGIR